MKTGLKNLDQMLGDCRGDVIVVGSRSGMGKSCLLRQIAWNHAMEGGTTKVWDEERHLKESYFRIACQIAEVDRAKVGSVRSEKGKSFIKIIEEQQQRKESYIDGLELQRLAEALLRMESLNISIHQSSRDFDSRDFDIWYFLDLIETNNKENLLVVIDFIQLLTVSDNTAQSTAKLMTRIKEVSVRTDTTFVIGSQISRKVDERLGHRPTLTDLSDSSSLEELANKVIFILRRDYYDPNDKPGLADIIIQKHSLGGVDSLCTTFSKEFSRFYEYSPFVFNEVDINDTDYSDVFKPL